MDKDLIKLRQEADLARRALQSGAIEYEDALEIVTRYTDFANEKAKGIAKMFGQKRKLIDPRGFLR